MDEWRSIPEFPGYSVSSTGLVRNNDTGYHLTPLVNRTGFVHVGLTRERALYKRGLALLVARAFIPPHKINSFTSPINLNGDRYDCNAMNLVWRPKWFAVKYVEQFRGPHRGYPGAIEDMNTEEIYPTSWEAALRHGLLDQEILLAIYNRTYVWPTFQQFRPAA
jgi:hypothetical protein